MASPIRPNRLVPPFSEGTLTLNPQRKPSPSPRTPNIDQPYLQNFNSSYDAARGAVDTSLAGSLGAIRASGDAAAKVLASLPQALQQPYRLATAQVGGAEAAMAAGLSADNRGGIAAETAPIRQALQATREGSAATAPLMEAARLGQILAAETAVRTQAADAHRQAASERAARQLDIWKTTVNDRQTQDALQLQRDQLLWEQEQARLERERIAADNPTPQELEELAQYTVAANSGYMGTQQEFHQDIESMLYKEYVAKLNGGDIPADSTHPDSKSSMEAAKRALEKKILNLKALIERSALQGKEAATRKRHLQDAEDDLDDIKKKIAGAPYTFNQVSPEDIVKGLKNKAPRVLSALVARYPALAAAFAAA